MKGEKENNFKKLKKRNVNYFYDSEIFLEFFMLLTVLLWDDYAPKYFTFK